MPVPTKVDEAVLHGYYRYTDVFFEWHAAASVVTNTGTLKALLNHEALVHPDHPLREPGEKGIKLYNGVLEDGETRLFFSSKQVEYLSYWLHAMEITPELIPVPHSSYLVPESSLRKVSPVVFTQNYELKKALKDIDKSNKRLKGAAPTLKSQRVYFEQVRTFWWDKVGTWLAIDFEGWELDHTLITEFGWSSVRWVDGEPVEDRGHIIIDEHQHYYNGQYVPDERNNYDFGDSQIITKAAFRLTIGQLISNAGQDGPLFLVFHDPSQDIKYMKSPAVQAPIGGLTAVLPDAAPSSGLFLIDTAELFAALEGKPHGDRRGLERACRLLGIVPTHMHNAGNDAEFTLQALAAMAGGDPVDLQREKRWPDRTNADTRLEVPFKPWEEEEEYSDMEGINGPAIASAGQGGYDPKTGWLHGYGPTAAGAQEVGDQAQQLNNGEDGLQGGIDGDKED